MQNNQQGRGQHFVHPVKHPEWLPSALESLAGAVRLHQSGRVPEKIQAWMLVTPMMRVMRAIHGSDRETLAALQQSIEEQEAISREVDIHMGRFPNGGCPDAACPICEAISKDPSDAE